ncbi:MAG: flotillin-like FloA family protein [Desulfococcaceae bacterium]
MEYSVQIYIIRILTVIILLLLLIIGFFYHLYRKKSFWLRALVLRSFVNPGRLLMMRMRGTDPALYTELRVRALEGHLEVSPEELESLAQSPVPDDARMIVETAVRAKQENIPADIRTLRSHKASGIDIGQLVDYKIRADKMGMETDINAIAAHMLARGNVGKIMEAMSIAVNTGESIDFHTAAAVDLAGRDILEAVKTLIQPRIIRTEKVTAVTRNGFEVSARAVISIRTDLEQIMGGAGEETILSRASQALLSAISNAESEQKILEDRESIADAVWKEDMDDHTAYEIVSFEISDIAVGVNIGVKKKISQAREEKEIAQAQAERKEQELKVRALETRSKYLEEEAKIPSALTEAFAKGDLKIEDYLRMGKNSQETVRSFSPSAQPNQNREESNDTAGKNIGTAMTSEN